MYSIDFVTSAINFPDGFVLPPPYDDPRYMEYVAWVNAGNSPTTVNQDSLLALEDVEANPANARKAMLALGVYDTVLALIVNPEIPRGIKITFEYTTAFRRNNPDVIAMAQILKWDKEFLDLLFTTAVSYN